MIEYAALRDEMRSGDLFLVEGRGVISTLIRVLTGQQLSHVALLVWIDGGLWVAEMREFVGFQLRPASLWLEDISGAGHTVYYGRAPRRVRESPLVKETALGFRSQGYGYLSLLQVWWAQLRRTRLRPRGVVCSTFVQRCWEAAGIAFSQTADPGDFLRLCDGIEAIEA